MIICIFLTSFLLLAQDPLGRAPDDFSSNELFTGGINHTENENQTWEKPNGFKIVAMVFCEPSPHKLQNLTDKLQMEGEDTSRFSTAT